MLAASPVVSPVPTPAPAPVAVPVSLVDRPAVTVGGAVVSIVTAVAVLLSVAAGGRAGPQPVSSRGGRGLAIVAIVAVASVTIFVAVVAVSVVARIASGGHVGG